MAEKTILRMACAATLLLAAFASSTVHSQQKMDNYNRDRARAILHDAYDNVKKHYYDTKFHGLDIDARFHQYDQKIVDASSLSQSFGVVAAFLDGLNDSHTFFTPAARPFRMDDGYRLQMYGNDCYITRVRSGTDAETKVHPGDQVLGYNKFNVNREVFWKMSYYFNSLSPQKGSMLEIRDPSGQTRQLTIDAKVRELKKVLDFTGQDGGGDIWDYIREEQNSDHVVRQRWVDAGDVMIWKMPEFFVEDHEVDRIFNDARKHKTLILDLRGNPGGAVVTLDRMVANLFDHEVKIADRMGRKDLKPEVAKTRGGDIFTGQLIVLVDSISASSGELFSARDPTGAPRDRHRGPHGWSGDGSQALSGLPRYGHESFLRLFHHRSGLDHERRQKPGTHGRDAR